MQRLVKNAAKLDKSIDANSLSYGNIVKAINAIQKEMGIYGTTQKEAEKTITGSLNAMKASWGNLLTAMASGENLDQCIDNMVDSVETFGKNLIPVAERALAGIGTVVERLTPIIAEKLPDLAEDLLPPLIRATISLTKGLIKALPNIIKTVVTTIVDIFGAEFPAIKKIGQVFIDGAKDIAKIIPVIIGLVAAFKGLKGIQSITSMFGGGKMGGGSESKGGLFSGLTNTFKDLAKTKTTVILKGMTNLAIIVGGFTLITTAFMLVAPHISKLADTGTMVKMIAIIAALGLVSGELSKLAGIVGKLPVTTVLKGLANMAIIVAGMSALFLLLGAVSLINFDLKRITKLVGIIGMLGVVGSALAIFAGIVGLVPIPVVLAGLANIALVMGGLTALVIAFGELAKVPGINDFISKGGDLLANLFGVIGKIAGSLIGGIGEGISESLPKIGANLSKFAVSLKPLFTMFNGVDMSGAGEFFSALGNFMLKMAGEKILSFFTGGNSLEGLGSQLSTFATESKGFFTTVSTFPEQGFTNAAALFKSLADIGNVPNTGGIAQWFSGTNDFEDLASGLKTLSGEGVTGFYNKVAKLPQEGFDKTKLLFQSLSDIGNIPNSGGVGQWFSGENDYDSLASGLKKLSGDGVMGFFKQVATLPVNSFENTKSFFESLKGIGDAVGNKGGLWGKIKEAFGGKDDFEGLTDNLSKLGKALKTFGENTSNFFTQINNLNLNNLNGLWESVKNADGITADSLKKVDKNIDEIVKKVSKLPEQMGEALKNSGNALGDGLVEVWKDAVEASVKPVNKVLEGANWILKEFGSKKRTIAWEPYAKGTGGHKGGNALVNDGNGAELVQMPNGNTFIPQGRNVFLPNAPKGMKVLPAEQTAQLMGRNAPTFKYAKGIGDIDIWSYIDNPSGLVGKISDSASYEGLNGFRYNLGKSIVSTFTGGMTSWVKKLFEEEGALSLSSYVASKGVSQWRSTVIRALKMEGQYSAANVARTLFQMKTESGGNPKAINLWDSNAKKGIPSKGLMQVIDPTFKAYARDGFDKNIYDPLSNILASVRYAVSRYGTLAKAYRGVGYEDGGLVTKPGWIGENYRKEMVIPLSASKRRRALDLYSTTGEMLGLSNYTPETGSTSYVSNTVENNNYSPQLVFNIQGAGDERALMRKIKRTVQEAIDDTLEGVERHTSQTREV